MYKAGSMTVICNETGGILNLSLVAAGGPSLALSRRDVQFVDIEDLCDKKKIKAVVAQLGRMTDQGLISWWPKNSKPVPGMKKKIRLPGPGESVTLPPNIYDDALNKLAEKEKKEDERTKMSGERGQQTRQGTSMTDRIRNVFKKTGGIDADAVVEGEYVPKPEDAKRDTTDSYQLPVGQLLDLAVDRQVVSLAASWYKFNNKTIGHGLSEACANLEKDPELLELIKTALRE